MKRNPYIRIIYDLCLVGLVLLAPGWVCMVFIVLGMFLFNGFYEGLVSAYAVDELFSVPLARYHHFTLVYTLSSFVLFLVVMYLKRIVSLYSRI